jgi:hypothetical protein
MLLRYQVNESPFICNDRHRKSREQVESIAFRVIAAPVPALLFRIVHIADDYRGYSAAPSQVGRDAMGNDYPGRIDGRDVTLFFKISHLR